MIIGLLENGNRELIFKDHKKMVTPKEWNEMVKGDRFNCIVIKTDTLTNEEYGELHYNIESKRTGCARGLMDINREIIDEAKNPICGYEETNVTGRCVKEKFF